ncbi:MAG TPA: NAD(P)H-dependent oxidoreductase subunit E [Caulobacteraceae bacterium]|nr:NAD(P)H-dependent oxidoreductase subunit E [Caulobacteraceae bacterium]
MAEYAAFTEARAAEIIAAHVHVEGAVVPILNAIQAAFGCVPREAVAMVAEALNLSRAEVHGVASFYHDYRDAPPGRREIRVCRAESCQARGGEAAARFLLGSLGIDWGGTSADGAVTVEAAYCLGLCAVSPAALVDGEPLGRVDGMILAEAARS